MDPMGYRIVVGTKDRMVLEDQDENSDTLGVFFSGNFCWICMEVVKLCEYPCSNDSQVVRTGDEHSF